MSREGLSSRIDAVERAYEFFLAFAAQGVRDDRESKSSGQLRQALEEMDRALDGLTDLVSSLTPEGDPSWATYLEALDRDARAGRAAVQLVRAQPAISSQLVDNLNASIHIRALLTDLFLVDELLAS